jgi:hypothetical protein
MSIKVLLGGNEFVDCANIVEVRGEQLLRVAVGPLRITLATPAGWDEAQAIAVVENDLKLGAKGARVVGAEHSVAVLSGDVPVVVAIADPGKPGEVHLRIDLRPIGIQLFDDASGLHVGSNLFTGNRVSNAATAISLE